MLKNKQHSHTNTKKNLIFCSGKLKSKKIEKSRSQPLILAFDSRLCERETAMSEWTDPRRKAKRVTTDTKMELKSLAKKVSKSESNLSQRSDHTLKNVVVDWLTDRLCPRYGEWPWQTHRMFRKHFPARQIPRRRRRRSQSTSPSSESKED